MLPHVALLIAIPVAAQTKPPPSANQPVVRYAIPLAVPPKKSTLVLRGSKLDTATAVQAAGVSVKLLGAKKVTLPNNYPAEQLGDTEMELELDVPTDFAGDTITLTAVTPAGSSAPLDVPVAKGSTAEQEPNDGLDKPQEITLPAVVEGTIGRERDTDVFSFAGKKGQKLTVRVSAAAHGSPADLLLTLYDADRRILALVDDVNGHPDPTTVITLPADGRYDLSLIEARDLGGSGFGYRLKVE